MSDDFFRTRMGQRFYEATMPRIADQLERMNTNLEALVAELRKQRETREQDAACVREPSSDSK